MRRLARGRPRGRRDTGAQRALRRDAQRAGFACSCSTRHRGLRRDVSARPARTAPPCERSRCTPRNGGADVVIDHGITSASGSPSRSPAPAGEGWIVEVGGGGSAVELGERVAVQFLAGASQGLRGTERPARPSPAPPSSHSRSSSRSPPALGHQGRWRTQYTLLFENAGQLVEGNEVQVGGACRSLGHRIQLTDDNQAAVKVRVEEPNALLGQGTRRRSARRRSEIANRYVALDAGAAAELADGATLGTAATMPVVDLGSDLQHAQSAAHAREPAGRRQAVEQFHGKGYEAARRRGTPQPPLRRRAARRASSTADEGNLMRFLVATRRAS